jgi:hypothetical protein
MTTGKRLEHKHIINDEIMMIIFNSPNIPNNIPTNIFHKSTPQ